MAHNSSAKRHPKFNDMQHYNTRTSLFVRERSKGYHRRRRRTKSLSILACDGGNIFRVLISHRSPIEEFRRLFPVVSTDEFLLNVYTCALSKDILLQGKMFVSQNWICFYSNIFGYETKVKIEISRIVAIKREKTAFVVPNAISVQTSSKRFFFCSFLSRETVFRLLSRTWQAASKIEDSDEYIDKEKPKRDITQAIDHNYNVIKVDSSFTFSEDSDAVYSDLDEVPCSSTYTDKDSSIMFPSVVHLNSLHRLGGHRRFNITMKPATGLTRWNTLADLREMKPAKKRLKRQEFTEKRCLPPKDRVTSKRDQDQNCWSNSSWTQSVVYKLSEGYNCLFRWLIGICSLYNIICVTIIILGMMSVFLLYKIHYLNMIFAERDGNTPMLCLPENEEDLSYKQSIYTDRLQR